MDKIEDGAKEASAKKDEDFVLGWLKDIEDAIEREDSYRKEGRSTIEIYEGDKKDVIPFNILFSNTETLAPALYNSVPRPVAQRRFKDEDAIGKAAGELVQRTLAYEIDTDLEGYEPFDDLIQSAVLNSLVPGRGLTRFKYDATYEKREVEVEDGMEPVEPEEVVTGELVCGESLAWDHVIFGYARRWKEVPWAAIEHDMTREELVDNFGKLGARVELTKGEDAAGESKSLFGSRKKDMKGVELGKVYEIWDKLKREVIFISPGYKDGVLKRAADPLNLSGFFPFPRPLQLLRRIDSLTPMTLYSFYEEQAKELNRVTVRINKLIVALKVRGLYDSTVEGIDKVLTADDNVMIPAENVAGLQQGQSLEKAFFLMPIEKLIAVLQQLYLQRTQVKTVIYEITGIADIMRGSSVASETLGAQEIKNQWGTLRLKRAQKEVARYVRDCLRIMAEISVTKMSAKTLKAMTGLPYPLAEEKQQAQMILQQMQQQQLAQQQMMPPQQPGMPPAQAQPPAPIPPEIQQAASMPSIEDLLSVLSNDLQRSYKIDIETNSTVDAEATEDKKDISELMNAVAQFLNGVAPAVEQGILPFEAAKAMLLGAVRRYRFGSDVEDMIKAMQAPAPKQAEPPDPTKSPEYLQMQAQTALQEQKMKQTQMNLEMQMAQQEHAFKMKEMQQKAALSTIQHKQKMELAMMPKPAPKPAGITPK